MLKKNPGENSFEIKYTDIGHEIKNSILLWHYDKELKFFNVKNKKYYRHFYENAIASGRIDADKKVGSIVFSPNLPDRTRLNVLNSLLFKFPDIKFFLFGEYNRGYISLKDYFSGETNGQIPEKRTRSIYCSTRKHSNEKRDRSPVN